MCSGHRPQRTGHVSDAIRIGVFRSRPSLFRSDFASNIRSHSSTARVRQEAPPAARRRRLQVGASLAETAARLQLLMFLCGTVGGRRLRPGPSRHQWHEPVFRAMERHANAAIVVGITPATIRAIAGGHPPSAPLGKARVRAGREQLLRAAQRVGDFLAGRPSVALGAVAPILHARRPHDRSGRLPPGLRGRGDTRSACRVRQTDQGVRMDDAVLTGVETRTSSPIRVSAMSSIKA